MERSGKGSKFSKAGSAMENSAAEDRLREIIDVLYPVAESYDFGQLIQFCERGFMSQTVQSWSYFAQVNNHVRFGRLTNLLYKVLVVCGRGSNVVMHGSSLIQLILTQYAKVLYRGVSAMRRGNTIPTLKFMREMINFNDSKFLPDFLAYFDLKITIFPKILTPTRAELAEPTDGPSFREFFLKFFLDLISKAPAILRKDILSDNFKLLSAWFKYMDKVDSHELIMDTLTVFVDSILKEPSFKKMTKTKVLNEMVLAKVHTFYYSGDKPLVKKVNEFFRTYSSDPDHSVAFNDDCVWFKSSPLNNDSKGVTITINQKEFKIYNKLLFSMLKIFKPWDDVMQTNTVISTLTHVPELIPPYCHYILSLGTHDPNVTSYWFGLTLLYGRIIRCQIPEFMMKIETDEIPNPALVIENILPAALSKGALTKTLQYENLLVKTMGTQLLAFAFEKLEAVLRLYDKKGWSNHKLEITSLFLSRIPELPVLVTMLNQVYSDNPEKKILLLSTTLVLRLYATIFPNIFNITLPSNNVYMSILGKEVFDGIEFSILDNFLQFQAFSGSQMKWWNSNATQKSLFTSLLFLGAAKTSGISERVSTILNNMTKNTIIFADLYIQPVSALLNSLQIVLLENKENDQVQKIAKLLDQTIARCIKTPYKYSDKSIDYERISPILIVLAEQLQFIDRTTPYDLVNEWVMIFLRNMSLIGESKIGIIRLVNSEMKEVVGLLPTYFDDHIISNNTNPMKKKEHIMNNSKNSSFCQFITLSSLNELSKDISRFATCPMDAAGLMSVIIDLITDSDIKTTTLFEKSTINILNALFTYINTDVNFKVLNLKFIDFLLTQLAGDENTRAKANFMISQFLIRLNESDIRDSCFSEFIVTYLLANEVPIFEKTREFATEILNYLESKDIVKLLEHVELLSTNATVVLNKISEATDEIPYEIFKNAIRDVKNDNFVSKFEEVLDKGKLQNVPDSVEIFKDISNNKLLFNVFFKSAYFDITKLGEYFKILGNCSPTAATVLSDIGSSEDILKFADKSLTYAIEHLEELDEYDFESLLKLVSKRESHISKEDLKKLSTFALESYKHRFRDYIIDYVESSTEIDITTKKKWMNKLILYITKFFSERNIMSSAFKNLITRSTRLFLKTNIWDEVSSALLNSQLEVVLQSSWISTEEVLQYVLSLMILANSKKLNCERSIQLLINNECISFRTDSISEHVNYLTALVLYLGFKTNPKKTCTRSTMLQIVQFYGGSLTAYDRIILELISLMEEQVGVSWINEVISWEYIEDSKEVLDVANVINLITSTKEGLVITLRKDFIENSIKYADLVGRPDFPEFENISNAETVMQNFEGFFSSLHKVSKSHLTNSYDPFSLMLLCIQNEDLISKKTETEETESTTFTYKFDFQKVAGIGLLEVIIINAASDGQLSSVSNILLNQLLSSINDVEQANDLFIFKLLLKKLIFSINHAKSKNNLDSLPKIIYHFIARLVPILLQPVNPLYERAYRWVLDGPFVRTNEIPLTKDIINTSESTIDHEIYFKQLVWILEGIEEGVVDNKDLGILKSKGVLEWLLGLQNYVRLSVRIQKLISSILYKFQRIEDGGSLLATRYGAISTLELQKLAIERKKHEASEKLNTNDKNSRHLINYLISEEQGLSNGELLEGFVAISNSQKRLREWTDSDGDNIIKRIHI
ncbi:Nucleolar pre-ribosomal-associated protein 1 [Nakaseomyces bracarensis]|uniref:Nucleolar pre-ribosomal-associated protein 1 n=1 Tax=Nakaseomyces bracarensis TaxID=273131 RepID=A0ABR4NXI4_9SACH